MKKVVVILTVLALVLVGSMAVLAQVLVLPPPQQAQTVAPEVLGNINTLGSNGLGSGYLISAGTTPSPTPNKNFNSGPSVGNGVISIFTNGTGAPASPPPHPSPK